MEGTLKVSFTVFDDGRVIYSDNYTATGVDVKCLYEKADEIDEIIMERCHSRYVEFTHTFFF